MAFWTTIAAPDNMGTSMDHYEVEESKEEAAKALGDFSHIALMALADGVTPSVVRRRLIAHVAGAPEATQHRPPSSSSDTPSRNGAVSSSHELRKFTQNLARPKPEEFPIVAYVRRPTMGASSASKQ